MLNKFAYIYPKGMAGVLDFFGRLYLGCFWLGFLAGWWAGLPEAALQS
jgi:hypothetical protein